MSDLTELPDWVWNLLDAVHAYEDEHPLLYRMTDVDVYERWACFGAFLSERKAWPPREIQDAAEFRRHVLQNPPSTEPTPDAHPASRESEQAAAGAVS